MIMSFWGKWTSSSDVNLILISDNLNSVLTQLWCKRGHVTKGPKSRPTPSPSFSPSLEGLRCKFQASYHQILRSLSWLPRHPPPHLRSSGLFSLFVLSSHLEPSWTQFPRQQLTIKLVGMRSINISQHQPTGPHSAGAVRLMRIWSMQNYNPYWIFWIWGGFRNKRFG